jgi:hypothetical protein
MHKEGDTIYVSYYKCETEGREASVYTIIFGV